MRIFTLLTTALLLSACQPQATNQIAQQQHFICKSLIEGFLKTQRLGEYQLDHLQPSLQHAAPIRAYTYRVSNDINMRLNMPTQQNLNFECQQDAAQHFEVRLVNQAQNSKQNLLSLDLPPQKTIDTLTAFALKTQ
ncbi:MULTISPECIES: hypothetical protein [unclassified Acinetobacter]|uniref:hypothetical protein n=1 Tax=unclassified Acinetobacter TaxID=196816 RepID=UPI00257865F3|nr:MULTISPECIES: hypothetical protein [unclassified Acinetobacter]MDM1765857.1 hypothetical protein [Acinetobacter sp. 226-1]MDM1769595.1 hypothetical protein [Acinetobacter sp. 226-4]